MKRALLFLGIGVLLVGGVLLAARAFIGRRAPSPPLPTEDTTVNGELPGSGGRDAATSPSPSPGSEALSIACPEQWLGLPDEDQDGLPDQVELTYHTDERNPDTDGDGFIDGEEIRAGYHPLKKEGNPRLDSDEDGLFDNDECRWKTDPFAPDTDGDGFRDGDEVTNGFDPAVKGDGKGSDALPVRRAQQATATLEQLRPNPNSPNYTEGLAGLLSQGQPLKDVGKTRVTPQQVENVLQRVPVSTALSAVPISDLKVGSANTPTDISAYLQAVDQLRPDAFADATFVTSALIGVLSGNTSAIRTLRGSLSEYEAALRQVTVPPSAVAYHRTLLSITRFVNDRFGEVEAAGKNDPVKVYLALRALQEGLPLHIQTLQTTRTQLQALAAGTS